jgi:hypothetical protein
MATGSGLDIFRDLLDEAKIVGQLAGDEKSFLAAYEAFRGGEPKEFRAVIDRAGLLARCRLVCDWIRSKECVFLCLELCGPPRAFENTPDARTLAQAIVRITADEKALRQLTVAVEKRDGKVFRELVEAYKLGAYCHLFCHWVCVVRYRLLCRWMCEGAQGQLRDLHVELRAAGEALRQLIEHESAFDAVAAASNAGDAEKVGTIIQDALLFAFCPFICEWLCSWRCTLVCLTFCRPWPFAAIENPLHEAHAFANVMRQFVEHPVELEKLSEAVGTGDTKTYAVIVERLNLQRYCAQLCHWICGLHCRRFCIRMCPPPDTIPLFTQVGEYRVDPMSGDFQPDGTTTSGHFAFTRTIPLNGILPDGQANEAYEYRFRIAQYTALGPPTILAPTQDVDTTMIPETKIGQLEYLEYDGTTNSWSTRYVDYYVNGLQIHKTIEIKQKAPNPSLQVPISTQVKAGGWIEVPRENQLSQGGRGRFVRDGDSHLAKLDTTKLISQSFDLRMPAPGLQAGEAMVVAQKSTKPIFKLFFEARKVVGGAFVNGNDLDRIAMCNSQHTYIRHAEWGGGAPPAITNSVCSLDIAEMIAPGASGCDRLHGNVHALYTGYHPYLQNVSFWFEGNGIAGAGLPTAAAPFTPLLAGADEVESPAGGHNFNIGALNPCAYILWMSTTVGLTDGSGPISDATEVDYIAFCVR